MPLTSPDSIPYPAVSDTVAPLNETLQGIAVATQAAFAKRQQGTYVWADEAARTAQTGMRQADWGYVLATKTPYLYDGGTWRLATPHAEFTASVRAVPNGNAQLAGTFAFDASKSTSTTIASAGTNGVIRITDPGLYAVSTFSNTRNAADTTHLTMTGRSFLDVGFVQGEGDINRVSVNTGEDRGAVSAPNVRVTAPDTPLHFGVYRNIADTNGITYTRARITRIA